MLQGFSPYGSATLVKSFQVNHAAVLGEAAWRARSAFGEASAGGRPYRSVTPIAGPGLNGTMRRVLRCHRNHGMGPGAPPVEGPSS